MVGLVPQQLHYHSLSDVYRPEVDVPEELSLVAEESAHFYYAWLIRRISIKLQKSLHIIVGRSSATVEESSG
jgi:hypothetical protein